MCAVPIYKGVLKAQTHENIRWPIMKMSVRVWNERKTIKNLSVFSVCSTSLLPGEIIAIIHTREFSPMNESRSTLVKVLPLNGTWASRLPSALMHSLSASSDLLISAPSILVMRSAELVSLPRSLPAKSMSEILPCSFFSLFFRMIWKTAWERDECWLADVAPFLLLVLIVYFNWI